MTKTKRQKRLSKIRRKKKLLKMRLEVIEKDAREKGFKSPEEYILWQALKDVDIDVQHNSLLYGFEVDLFIKPNLIVEVGFLDENLKNHWNFFEEKGYNFLYFSNMEIHNKSVLKNSIGKIKKILNRAGG